MIIPGGVAGAREDRAGRRVGGGANRTPRAPFVGDKAHRPRAAQLPLRPAPLGWRHKQGPRLRVWQVGGLNWAWSQGHLCRTSERWTRRPGGRGRAGGAPAPSLPRLRGPSEGPGGPSECCCDSRARHRRRAGHLPDSAGLGGPTLGRGAEAPARAARVALSSWTPALSGGDCAGSLEAESGGCPLRGEVGGWPSPGWPGIPVGLYLEPSCGRRKWPFLSAAPSPHWTR